jgi:hypothetical protein
MSFTGVCVRGDCKSKNTVKYLGNKTSASVANNAIKAIDATPGDCTFVDSNEPTSYLIYKMHTKAVLIFLT